MDSGRIRLYRGIEKGIGNTSLVEYLGDVPNENRVYVKQEFDNPYGSHYDRVYAALFRDFETRGQIKPGDKVIETTSGSAGVSFAGIGMELGYDCYVVLPAGGEKAREDEIKKCLSGADHLILTPAGDYVNGFPKFLKRFLARNRDFTFLNHSMGQNGANNEITLSSLEKIATEIEDIIIPDFYIPAMGNGSSVLGPGRVFEGKTSIIPFETFQSAVAYDLLNPGDYERQFGISIGTLERHEIPGTSFPGIKFPHMINAINSGLVREVILVSSKKMDENDKNETGRDDSESLIHWDKEISNHEEFGRSTIAGINVSLSLAEKTRSKTYLVLGYDNISRYDSKK
jgi:cysteine synthase